jgi:hypothetical protein
MITTTGRLYLAMVSISMPLKPKALSPSTATTRELGKETALAIA